MNNITQDYSYANNNRKIYQRNQPRYNKDQ
jgi:hypothetical protein